MNTQLFELCLVAIFGCTGGNIQQHPMTPIQFQHDRWISEPFLSHYKSSILKMFGWARKHSRDHEGGPLPQIWMGLASADMSVDWTSATEAGSEAGYSVTVGTEHWTVLRDHPFYTLPALRPERAYTVVITPVGVGDDNLTSLIYPFTTPTLVSDDNVNYLIKENRKKNCSSVDKVKVTGVSLTIKLSGVDTEGLVLEALDLTNSKPIQWVDLPINSTKTVLTGLQPDKFIQLKLKRILSSTPLTSRDIITKKIFTGGCLSQPLGNLTRTLDLFFPYRGGLSSSSRWDVRCYADDEVFTGFPCHNSDICVPKNWMCDKEEDCPDGDDEDDCDLDFRLNTYCRKNEFRCLKRNEHVCMPIDWLCDGRHDCTDGWDEDPRNCRGYYGRPGGVNYHGVACRDSYFRCRNNLGCVAPKFICDGEQDCGDGSDEWNCGSDYHSCDSYKEFQCFLSRGREKCIPRTWVCDDQEDCAHGEDEDYDTCRRVLD